MSYDHFPHGLFWIKTLIETLGITIVDNDEANFKHNFLERIPNLKSNFKYMEIKKTIS